MRVLLHNCRKKLYYCGSRQLGVEPERALDFGTIPDAARFAFEEKLPDMGIVLRDDSCGAEIPLPVLPEWCLFEERALRLVAGSARLGLQRFPGSLACRIFH